MTATTDTIATVDVWVVNVPLTGAFRSSFETKTGETRTIVKITTADGVVGWGETMWGAPVARLVRQLAEELIGTSPYDLEPLRRRTRMTPFFHGYLGYAALAALDVACWDVIGKTAGLALVDLLGGRVRTRIPITALITRADAAGTADTELPKALAEHAAGVVAEGGFTAVKLKGTEDVDGDVAIMRALRDSLPDTKLRVDPNGAWSVPDSIRAGRAMEELGLEYLEDPCSGLEPMARVRREVRIPLCTNMCVVRLEDIAPAVRLDAVDVIHGDVYKWGGIGATKALAAHCETFGLGMNLHSGGELGLSTAAHLQVAAALPQIRYAIDSVYYLFEDDILPERLPITGGAMEPPPGPGLGVEPSVERLEHHQQLNAREGDLLL